MESVKYTITKAEQAIQELDFGEDTCDINQYIKKRMQNNYLETTILNNKYGKARYFTSCVSHASKSSAHICFCRKTLFHIEKIVGQGQKV